MHPKVVKVSKAQITKELPEFAVGDTVSVHVRIKEGDKERLQVFTGTVISRRGTAAGASFTVRRLSYGIGAERVFPLCSPNIARLVVDTRGRARRAKLYYLRQRVGKAARVKTKKTTTATAATTA